MTDEKKDNSREITLLVYIVVSVLLFAAWSYWGIRGLLFMLLGTSAVYVWKKVLTQKVKVQ